MKILENISSGYKKIATGIAIVGFLSMLYLALIPGASIAHVYGPNGGILSGAFVFIKEWPQYNDTTAIDGTYAIDQMPIGEYTLVGAGNDSYAPNITSINVTVGNTNPHDITLKPAIKYYLPFLYQNDVSYQSGFQVQNNGTSNASLEITFYNLAGTKAGNDFSIVQQGELLNKYVLNVSDQTGFVGAAMLKSDKPIMNGGYIYSMGQRVYSLAPSMTDSDATTSMFIPFLYNGNAYDAGMQIFNPGSTSAIVTIRLYNLGGIEAANTTITIPPKNLGAKTITSMLAGGFVGSANITSDQPIVAQGYIRTTLSGIYSIAPSLSKTVKNAYIPFLYNGNAYDAGMQILNPGSTSASVTIRLYNLGGIEVANTTITVPQNNLGARTVSSMIAEGFVGSANITSDQPIVAQGYVRTNSNVYSVAPQVLKPESAIDTHVPYLYDVIGSHDSGVQVVNPNDVTANINVYYYHANGTLAGSYSGTVAKNGLKGITVRSIVPGGLIGYAIMNADQPIVTQGYIRQSTQGYYSIAPPVER